jgi:hypothetical protein
LYGWDREVAIATIKLRSEAMVDVDLDMDAPRCEVEYDLLTAYRTYFDEYECSDLARRLIDADVNDLEARVREVDDVHND